MGGQLRDNLEGEGVGVELLELIGISAGFLPLFHSKHQTKLSCLYRSNYVDVDDVLSKTRYK